MTSELQRVFARFGEAASHSQSLEAALVNLLLVRCQFAAQALDASQISSLESIWTRKTMGALLSDVRDRGYLSEEQLSDLESARERRNYLIHRFFYENAEALSLASRWDQLEIELVEISSSFKRAIAVIEEAFLDFLATEGLDRSAFEQLRDRTMSELVEFTEQSWRRS